MLLSVTQVTALDEMLELARSESTRRVTQFERPQEVAGLLEVGPNGKDLVNQILHADDAVLAEIGFDQGVIGQGDALLVDLAVSTLIDELPDGLEVRIPVGDPGFYHFKHLGCGLGETNKDAVVDLDQTQKLKDLAWLGGDLVDTVRRVLFSHCSSYRRLGRDHLPLDADNKDQLRLGRNEVRALLLAETGKANPFALSFAVLPHILLSTLEDDASFLLVNLWRKPAISQTFKGTTDQSRRSSRHVQTRKMV